MYKIVFQKREEEKDGYPETVFFLSQIFSDERNLVTRMSCQMSKKEN